MYLVRNGCPAKSILEERDLLMLRKAFSLTVLLLCAILLASYIGRHLSDFESLSNISFIYILLIGCCCLLALSVNGLFLKVLTIDFGIDLSFLEHFSISIVTSFGNTFLPMKGGAGLRAVYLKSKYNFDYSYFLSSLAGNYLVVFNVTSLAALIGMFSLYFVGEGFHSFTACVFLLLYVLTSWGIFYPPAVLDWIPVKLLREHINQVLAGWQMIRKSRRTVLELFILTILYVMLSSLATWLEFAAFGMKDSAGVSIGFLKSVSFTAIAILSLLISLTPAALGIKEGMLMLSSQFLGISPSQALAVSLLDRTMNFTVLALFFGFASFHLKKQLRQRTRIPPASLS